ncbi:MAG TPA: hypothetical protein DCG79_04120, partial [Clostridiales bacterium]|nr:hypothetical protein [Clostridiales bacterium]
MEKFPSKSDSVQVVGKGKGNKVKVAKYDRSFLSRVIQDDWIKYFYDEIKNYCMAFEKVKERSSWDAESFAVGNDTIVKMVIFGGELCVCVALDYGAVNAKDFPHADFSKKKKFAGFGTFAPVRSPQEARTARRLIAEAFTSRFIYTEEFPAKVDYMEQLPMQDDESLIESKQVKKSESDMTPTEAKKAIAAAEKAEDDEAKELEKTFGKVKRPVRPKKQPVEKKPEEAPAKAPVVTEENTAPAAPAPEEEIEDVVFEFAEEPTPEPEP